MLVIFESSRDHDSIVKDPIIFQVCPIGLFIILFFFASLFTIFVTAFCTV